MEGHTIGGRALPSIESSWFLRPDGHLADRSIHGVAHALRVWVHAQEIAEELGLAAWQCEVLDFAARWHDIGRTHDGADYYHGGKSAGKAVGLGLHRTLDPVLSGLVLDVITHHSGDDSHGERAMRDWPDGRGAVIVYRVFKDADALDRVRFHGLDVSFLRTEPAVRRVERAWELLNLIPGPMPIS